jgi:hypothetical protein
MCKFERSDFLLGYLNVTKKLPIRLPESVYGKERLWTRAALADWATCSTTFLDEEIRAGRLKAIVLSSSRIRFRWCDIQDWVAGKEKKITQPLEEVVS